MLVIGVPIWNLSRNPLATFWSHNCRAESTCFSSGIDGLTPQ